MRKGFIFNHDVCVACRACSAACYLENNWEFGARNIYSSNHDAFLPGPVLNLSMACNHCDEPVCLYGCPSSSYYRDKQSKAVIIDPEKCLGCRYCTWNCPYDAPKFNIINGVIEKCHYCYLRQADKLEPACSSGCPTGALSFGEIPEEISVDKFIWMPGKKINPSLLLTGNSAISRPETIPGISSDEIKNENRYRNKNISGEWSLILFSFLSILSVALNLSGLFIISPLSGILPVTFIIAAAIFSVYHLGNKKKWWRAAINIRHSPLSLEITVFALYSILLILDLLVKQQLISFASALSGLLLLWAIDNVYFFSSAKSFVRYHSGQALVSGLLITSFFLGAALPFLFIALLKLVSGIYRIRTLKEDFYYLPLRIFRLALLIVASAIIITGFETGTAAAISVFLAGEFFDRVIFYYDFEPVNIRNTITLVGN